MPRRVLGTAAALTASALEPEGMLPALRGCGSEPCATADWRFLHAYPNHYVTQRLADDERIVIDGKLDEQVWEDVAFTDSPFVDIAQPRFPDYVLPKEYDTKVKVRWDSDNLYVGALIGEPWVHRGSVWGSNPHLKSSLPIGNSNVPYYDNDFEIFIDVSGTNYFYKEFEMNFNNATYDVLWRSPDAGLGSTGVPCCANNKCRRWCQNSSWPGFGGTWSMYPKMKTATSAFPGGWSVEIAFPLHEKDGTGGLLSGGNGWERFDPNLATKYWLIDFSRAEHPFFTSNASLFAQLCPSIQAQQPTLLGADQWSCYWEWVWQAVGGHRYMHNPDNFGFLQFEADRDAKLCGNIEFPVRYVLAQVYQMEIAHAIKHGVYSRDLAELANSGDCTVKDGCNAEDVLRALTDFGGVFDFSVDVDNSATHCVKYDAPSNYTGGPCFAVSLKMTVPETGFEVLGSIREDRYLNVSVKGTNRPCLALS